MPDKTRLYFTDNPLLINGWRREVVETDSRNRVLNFEGERRYALADIDPYEMNMEDGLIIPGGIERALIAPGSIIVPRRIETIGHDEDIIRDSRYGFYPNEVGIVIATAEVLSAKYGKIDRENPDAEALNNLLSGANYLHRLPDEEVKQMRNKLGGVVIHASGLDRLEEAVKRFFLNHANPSRQPNVH